MIMMDVMTHLKIKMMITMEYWMLMTNVITLRTALLDQHGFPTLPMISTGMDAEILTKT